MSNMPTSSQAMILRHEVGSSTKIIQKGKNSTETIPCPVVNFDITQTFKAGLAIEKSKEVNGRALQIRKSYCKRTVSSNSSLLSCRGLLLYDNETGSYFWKDATVNSSPLRTMSPNSFARDDDESQDVVTNEVEFDVEPSEANTAKKDHRKPSICTMYGVNEELYGRLVELGFRKQSSVEKDWEKKQRSLSHITYNSCNRPINNIIIPTAYIRKTVSFSADNMRITKNTDCDTVSQTSCSFVSEEPAQEQEIRAVQKQTNEDEEEEIMKHRAKREKILGLLEFIKQQTNWDHRVSPSIFMRREKPEPSPHSICFSLPMSTDYTHLEIKKVLESLIKSEVTCIQYDPVSVRAQNPEVKCRWTVTLSNIEDVRLLIRKGFDIEDVHVVVRLLDGVINKEYETFHCIKDIEEERVRVLKQMNTARQKKRLSFSLGT